MTISGEVESRVASGLAIGAEARYEVVRTATLADGRNPLEGLAEIVVALSVNQRPLEALEASAELEEFLQDFRTDLVDVLRGETPSRPWSAIASALKVTKQAAQQRFAGADGFRQNRPRPGPRSETRRDFLFSVNKSFVSGNSPITIPAELNDWVAARLLPEQRRSKAIMIDAPGGRSCPGRFRYSVTNGHGYYQLTAPRDSLGLRFGERVEVTLDSEAQTARVRIRRLHSA